MLGCEKQASLNGETHASVRGVEWLRQKFSNEKWMVSRFVVLRVGGWGKTSLEGGMREPIGLNTKHFPSARPNQTTSDFDWKGELWPRVTVYIAVSFLGKRRWRQITQGNRTHIKSYYQWGGLYFLLQVLEELTVATCFITNFWTTLENDREINVSPLKVMGMLTTLLLCTSNAASDTVW